ncbi:MAG: DUF1819 family protein [Caldisericales bacterium]|nr:DUF1819 family protein [Caldisericales bacterium]
MIGAKDVTKYYAGLTGEPFLFSESRILAGFLAEGEDIELLRTRNVEENLIMHKKIGSLKRVSTPIFRRIATMSPNMLKVFTGSDIDASRIALLVSIAKTDRIVRDFLVDVYADKLATKASKIDRADIERYFESVYAEEPLIRDRSEQTKSKLKQQLMKIMAEAGLVKKQADGFAITRPNITTRLANQLTADGDSEYLKALGGEGGTL